MSKTLIELHQLRFHWPAQPLLLDIPHFVMQPRERVFLKGPSGSGKTSLLGLLGGVQQAQQGQLQLLGHSLSTLSQGARDQLRADHLGFIFQQFNLLPFLSVLDNVCLACRFSKRRSQQAAQRHGSVQQAAQALLNSLGLAPTLWQRRADQLSIGQQQRVAAVRALIGQPELIIADEPTSALDSDSRHAFLNLLFSECQAAGSGLLFVSHDQSLAPHFDRALSLNELNRASQPTEL